MLRPPSSSCYGWARCGWHGAGPLHTYKVPDRRSRRRSVAREKFDDLHDVPRAAHRRHAFEYSATIPLGEEPRVADHENSAIILVANKAPGPLLQRNDGLRQLKLDECISAFAI